MTQQSSDLKALDIADLLERCGERIGGGEPNTFTDEIYDAVDRLRAISAARNTVDRDASQVRDSSRQSSNMVERMGEALFALSDSLRESLGNHRLSARYEAVVAAWRELTDILSLETSRHSELMAEAKFLSERLRSFYIELVDEDAEREFRGHVAPSLARLEALLTKIGGDA